jgi:hypothetical protein
MPLLTELWFVWAMLFYKDAAPTALKRVWLVLEVFMAGIIFDRNPPVRFHQPMFTKARAKRTVNGIVHAPGPET